MKPKDFDGNNAAVHDEQESIPTNTTGNRPFADVLEANLSRRTMMRGTLAAAVAGILAPQDLLAAPGGKGKGKARGRATEAALGELCNFSPVTIEQYTAESLGATVPVISSDYEYQVLIPWGTPIRSGVPEYAGDPAYRPFSYEQEEQIGIGHDGMWLFPENGDSNYDGMLCINHEFGRNTHLLGKGFPENLADVRLSQAGHGCSVVRVAADGGNWGVVFDDRNRRITVNSPVVFDGPVGRHEAFAENLDHVRGVLEQADRFGQAARQ